MTTPYYVIVETDSAYNNEKKITEDISIVVNTTIESVEHINRKGKVIASPSFTILKEGDEVILHHNIFRLRNGVKGEKVESNFFIEDGKYFVPPTEIFMFRRDGGEWEALDPYCFIRPIKEDNKEEGIFKGDIDSYKGNKKQYGVVVHPNKEMLQMGLKRGDTVIFSKYSEYEFEISGEILYKMETKDILAVI